MGTKHSKFKPWGGTNIMTWPEAETQQLWRSFLLEALQATTNHRVNSNKRHLATTIRSTSELTSVNLQVRVLSTLFFCSIQEHNFLIEWEISTGETEQHEGCSSLLCYHHSYLPLRERTHPQNISKYHIHSFSTWH